MGIVTALSRADLITAKDLFTVGELGPCELIDGRVVFVDPATAAQGLLATAVASELGQYVRPRKHGRVLLGGVGIVTRRYPDTVRAADVAFISHACLPQLQRSYLEVAPELVVEIMSPSDRWQDIRSKLDDYFSIGVERVWIVEPERRTVLVYRSSTDLREFGEDDVLKGEGVLEGFELPVAELFAEL